MRTAAHVARRACALPSCKRYLRVALVVAAVVSLALFNSTNYLIPRIEGIEERLVEMQAHVQYLTALYWARLQDLLDLEMRAGSASGGNQTETARARASTRSPDLAALINSNLGYKAIEGLEGGGGEVFRAAYVGQLLPHLLAAPRALRPAYHLRSARAGVDTVIGVPTVRRDHETYLTVTLDHLIKGLTDAQRNDTLIVIFVGETDLLYVLNTAILIEKSFPGEVRGGLIEVLAPAAEFYPDLAALAPTLGDSPRRFQWRTKQNLDLLYLMAYSLHKGTYYLMMEDDVIARKFYMTDMKRFRTEASLSQPQWFFIEFCPSGAIGKLFKSSSLLRFLVYVQLFYDNAPIDWLLESYLTDKTCTDDKFSKECAKKKLSMRPRFKQTLFIHVGLISSLRGKIQKTGLKSANYSKFFPHANPRASRLYTTMRAIKGHSLARAYRGESFFWAERPNAGDVVEIWFERPTQIDRYLIRTGNVEFKTDRLYHGVVEALPANETEFAHVAAVDEFGLADGELRARGPLRALRLRLTHDNPYALLISEIDLRAASEPSAEQASAPHGADAASGTPTEGKGAHAGAAH